MKRFVAIVLVAATACASDKRLVQDAAAAYTYAEWVYEEQCVKPTTATAADCNSRYLALKRLKAVTTICNDVEKIGKLPKNAKKDLKEAQRGLDNAGR
jgi:hypothetical protein